jgi:hypothetical protein
MPEQMPHQISPWITFLRQYGPIPQCENAFDERIESSLKRCKVAPIRVELEHLNEILQNFRSTTPRSIILTGTAGDGKTFYCREAWRALRGDQPEWNTSAMTQTLTLGGVKLVVVKDLSEITGAEKNRQLRAMADAFSGQSPDTVYLVAANDGQLLEGWMQAGTSENIKVVRDEIEELLVRGQRRSEKFNFDLYNLSRTSAETVFPRVLKAILAHPGWSDCGNCRYGQPSETGLHCPILENKRRLEGASDNQLAQHRLRDLLELSELNGRHLPIRQMLILVSNILLGYADDEDAKDGLLTCKTVPKIISKGSISKASLYQNVFGENLTERRRETKDVFRVLRIFGIGTETSNFTDNLLIFGEDDPDLRDHYRELVLNDPLFGADPDYKARQQAYLEGNENQNGGDFLKQLAGQRQRLFFTLPERYAAELRLWHLTTFHFANEYLNEVHRKLLRGEVVKAEITARLVRGLNRIFTGLLAKNDAELILATSGSYTQARVCQVYEDAISVRPDRGESIRLKSDPDLKRPGLIVSLAAGLSVTFPLNLRRFEYLSRIAEGALPNSFSRECYEDILSFKASLLRQLSVRRSQEGSEDDHGRLSLRLIARLNGDGYISHPDDIEIKTL